MVLKLMLCSKEMLQQPLFLFFLPLAQALNTMILPTTFPLALLKGTFEEQLGDQKCGVDMILQKMKLQEIHPEHVESWAHFWST